MKKNIFLERRHTGLLGYRLIKSILRLACQRTCSSRALEFREHSHGQKFMALENTKTDFFTDLVTFDVESGLQELPEHLLHQTNIKTFNEDEETLSLDVLKSNIQQVLANFNQKEIYIIEHLLGSWERAVIFRRDSS
jgi:hypothetical protein